MATVKTVHECLFCPQVFDSATAKDDHVLEHFAQETCTDCNQNLIRIGGHLYVRHSEVTCIKGEFFKLEENNETAHIETEQHVVSEPAIACFDGTPVKEEPIPQYVAEFDFQFDTHLSVHSDDDTVKNVNILEVKAEPTELLDEQDISIDDVKSNSNEISHKKSIVHRIECDICGKYLHPSSLNRHKLLVHSIAQITSQSSGAIKKKSQIPCKFCGRLLSERSLREHYITQHNEREENDKRCPIPCDICGKKFIWKKLHEKHKILQHSPPGTIFCNICARIFSSVDDRDAHQLECTAKNRVACEICGKVLSKTVLQTHTMRFHRSSDVIYCSICSRKFTNAEDRDLHKIQCSHKRSNRKLETISDLGCDICGKVLSSKNFLAKHKILAHRPEGTIFCTKCARIFSNVADRDAHEKECALKLKVRKQNYRRNYPRPQCEVCGKNYFDQTTLRKHMVLFHSAPGTIFCRHCAKKFPSIIERDMHSVECGLRKKMWNSNQTPRKFECFMCKEVFNAQYKIRNHMQQIHNTDKNN